MSGPSGPSGAYPSEHARRAQAREHAVADVLDGGMSLIGAAVLWGIPVAVLEPWVNAAITERNTDAEGAS